MSAPDDRMASARADDGTPGVVEFETTDTVPALVRGELHLWHWQAGGEASIREVPTLARGALDGFLQAYAGTCTPVTIERGPHGKPFVADAAYPHFNISHSRHCVVLAFAAEQEIGVDVEAEDRRHSPMDLAQRYFAAEEFAALAALDNSAQAAAFLRLWTAKEAVLKALGLGLSFGLDRLRFDLDDGGRSTTLRQLDEEAGKVEEWQLLRFQPTPLHVGALAWRGAPLQIRAFRLQR